MRRVWMVMVALVFGAATTAWSQSRWNGMQPVRVLAPLPAGITLPVYVMHGLKAGSAKVGAVVQAVTTEPIPLSRRRYLPQGTRVVGTVVASKAADKHVGTPALLEIEFMKLSYKGASVAVRASVVAIANSTDVSDTYASTNDGSDRGNASPANWTTRQIGGDQVYREGWQGPVESATMQRVGYADFHGVYADAPTGASGVSALPRAVGVFSTDAHGLYGFSDEARLQSAGGVAKLTSPGSLVMRGGDALLLETIP